MKSLAHDFPEIITLGAIGESYEKRPISLITLDARKFLIKENIGQQHSSFVQTDFIKPQKLMETSVDEELNEHFHKEPAVMLTGQHHAREIVTN